jgi:hypothetical protein
MTLPADVPPMPLETMTSPDEREPADPLPILMEPLDPLAAAVLISTEPLAELPDIDEPLSTTTLPPVPTVLTPPLRVNLPPLSPP